MIFFDFPPRILEPAGLISAPRCESLRDVMVRANQWIQQNQIKVLTVETLLPNIYDDSIVIADATSMRTPDGYANWAPNHPGIWYEKS